MIWIGLDIATALSEALAKRPVQDPIFFLCSKQTQPLCLDLIDMAEITIPANHVFAIADGENAKNLDTCASV